jgi:hypothetical protein
MLSEPAFAFVLASVALGLFSWPLLKTPPPSAELECTFVFAAWLLVVLLLFAVSRSQKGTGR